ncbi:phosphatase PAP2 family protein [Patescibacteria group bacterium]
MNEKIFYALNNLAGQYEWLDAFIFFCAEYIGWLMLGGLVVYLFMHRHESVAPKEKWEIFLENKFRLKAPARNILVILSSAFIAWCIAHVIKDIIAYPRPFLVFAESDMNLLFEHGGYNSFPSGHTTFFAALAVALTFFHKRLGAFYLVGALLIGVARIIGGVHWPIDILAGYALGGAVAWAVVTISRLGSGR